MPQRSIQAPGNNYEVMKFQIDGEKSLNKMNLSGIIFKTITGCNYYIKEIFYI